MYDIIIIGAGTAGIAAYKEAIKYTPNILIINQGPWDTTCARVGCMPSKILISAANQLYTLQKMQHFGLNVQAEIDHSEVMNYLQKLRNRFTQATLQDVQHWPDQHKISGQAHFIDANTIEVNAQKYQAKSFILAVGSYPTINPQDKRTLSDRLITSDQIFELEQLPQSIAVIGSGIIAIELAQALHRLGVKTDIFARSQRIGSLTSPELQSLAQTELNKELNLHFGVLPTKLQKTAQGVLLTYTENTIEKSLHVEYLLVATGRTSHLNSLQLENINNSFKQTKNLPIHPSSKQLADYPIFIVGDAQTTTPLQHEAAHEGRGAVHNCLNYPKIKNLKTLTPLSIVFSQPQMAIVGQSHKQLTEQNVEFVTGIVDYSRQGRAIVLGKNQGAAEIYIDVKSRLVLGAELFVDAAEHLAHLLAWVIDEQLSLDDLLNKPFYHPTLEEGLRTALKHARRQLNSSTN